MAQDYLIADRAQLLAESLGIKPGSYAGREADAVVAMAIVAGYPRLTRSDQNQVLYVISDDMGFGASNPAFVGQCRGVLALMIANPDWVPGSLSKDDLEHEIQFWRNVKWVLDKLGISALSTYLPAKGRDILQSIEKNLSAQGGPKGLAALTGPFLSTLKEISAPFVFKTGAATLTESSLSDLEAEVTRRGQLGTMSRLEVERYGSKK